MTSQSGPDSAMEGGMRHSPTPRRRAFTMIEILIVLSVVAIITSISTVGFTRILNQVRIDRAAKTLSYDLQMAFALVGRNRQPVRIIWNPTLVQFTITDRGNIALYRTRPMGPATEFKLLAKNFTVSSSMVEIYPPGLAATSLNVHIVNGSLKRTIAMSRGGLVRVTNE
jgi:prepilin-type N-terminal cleavage/methylation domain-containing protein